MVLHLPAGGAGQLEGGLGASQSGDLGKVIVVGVPSQVPSVLQGAGAAGEARAQLGQDHTRRRWIRPARHRGHKWPLWRAFCPPWASSKGRARWGGGFRRQPRSCGVGGGHGTDFLVDHRTCGSGLPGRPAPRCGPPSSIGPPWWGWPGTAPRDRDFEATLGLAGEPDPRDDLLIFQAARGSMDFLPGFISRRASVVDVHATGDGRRADLDDLLQASWNRVPAPPEVLRPGPVELAGRSQGSTDTLLRRPVWLETPSGRNQSH